MRPIRWICAAALILALGVPHAFAQKERVVSKSDADEIFALDRAGWEQRARQFTHPRGWVVRLQPTSTGTGVMSFDRATGMGLSIQPLFGDDPKTPPNAIVVTSSFLIGGTMPVPDKSDTERFERDARADLGEGYNVSARIFDMSPKFRAVEIMITRK